MQLFHRITGQHSEQTLIFLHGLFGSSTNWSRIARQFESKFRVVVVDLRNHGRSFHNPDVSYQAQMTDVLALMDDLDIHSATIIGHSMGGKVAMTLAFQNPERIEKLVVADIAPVSYSNRFGEIFSGMLAVDLDSLKSRQDADGQLATWVPESPVRSYLMQNLVRGGHQWDWRINLDALSQGINELMEFPVDEQSEWSGQALFIDGGLSPYMDDASWKITLNHFPAAERYTIPDAGHWIYAEQPEQFTTALEQFLGSTN